MTLSSNNQFGLIVAYLLPGFIGLAGIAHFVPLISVWLRPTTYAEASLGPPIYVLIAATTIGMVMNALRWIVVDHVHWWTGMVPPVWDDTKLETRLDAFDYLVENHYRYYQFVANTLVAVLWTYLINRLFGTSSLLSIRTDIGVAILCAALFATSRETLLKYYSRTSRLLGVAYGGTSGDSIMHNGNDHGIEGGASQTPRPETKPDTNPQKPSPAKDGKAKPATSQE
jgi:hypothetical protein